MVNNTKRIGRVTSSQIHRIADSHRGPGKFIQKGQTYFEELRIEKMLGRSKDTEGHSNEMTWGKFGEIRVFNLMSMEYSMTHKMTKEHPDFPMYWSGTADLVAEDRVGEIKCFYPKNFGKLLIAMNTGDPEQVKKADPKTYWQVVSNSLIHRKAKAEIVIYMPYESEADEIYEMASDPEFATMHGFEPWQLRFIAEATDPERRKLEKLPFLPEDSKVKNLNVFTFDIPEADKLSLNKAMIDAVKEF